MTRKEKARARVLRYLVGTIILFVAAHLTAWMVEMPATTQLLGQLGIPNEVVVAVWYLAPTVAVFLLIWAMCDLLDATFG